MLKQLYIRVDGSKEIGMGHISRCINLGHALIKVGFQPIFVTKISDLDVNKLILRKGFLLVKIQNTGNLLEEICELNKLILKRNIPMVITDICHWKNKRQHKTLDCYFNNFIKNGIKTVVIDDYVKIDASVDIQIIPYDKAELFCYTFSSKTLPLLGTKYFILNDNFQKYRFKKKISREVNKILILIGGKNPVDISKNIFVRLINKFSNFKEIKIIIGENFKDEANIFLKLNKHYINFELIIQSNCVEELLSWADFAIIGGGLIKYECAAIGTPCTIISQNIEEEFKAKEFCKSLTAKYVGRYKYNSYDSMITKILKVFNDYELRTTMHNNGDKIIDGKGASRVVKNIINLYEK